MSYDHTPKEEQQVKRVSETSKYFGKKKFKSGDYTKTDSDGRICLYNAKHRFIRYLSFIASFIFIIGCEIESSPKEYTKTTYTNYEGYWGYCRYQTNEIDTELKYFSSERVKLFEHEVVNDTTICKGMSCPRNGEMTYQIRITIE